MQNSRANPLVDIVYPYLGSEFTTSTTKCPVLDQIKSPRTTQAQCCAQYYYNIKIYI